MPHLLQIDDLRVGDSNEVVSLQLIFQLVQPQPKLIFTFFCDCEYFSARGIYAQDTVRFEDFHRIIPHPCEHMQLGI